MNIADMHIMFRQLVQQMGMQNVRAILPEQIDLLLNTAIVDVINEIIKRNIMCWNTCDNTDTCTDIIWVIMYFIENIHVMVKFI